MPFLGNFCFEKSLPRLILSSCSHAWTQALYSLPTASCPSCLFRDRLDPPIPFLPSIHQSLYSFTSFCSQASLKELC
jgi:hypothetical protein